MKKENDLTPAALNAAASGNLENFLAASTPGGIERQEARGQQSLITNSTLPKDIVPKEKAILEACGVKFGDDADDIFVNVELPAGWKKQATEHSMWNDLLDEKGRKRAAIFYKAAFYDRSAKLHLNRRYSVRQDYKRREEKKELVAHVLDGDRVIFVTPMVLEPEEKSWEAARAQESVASAWLTLHFPEWKNAGAYWD